MPGELTVASARHILTHKLVFGSPESIQAVRIIEALTEQRQKGRVPCPTCEASGTRFQTCGECGSEYESKCPDCKGTGDRLNDPYLTLDEILKIGASRP